MWRGPKRTPPVKSLPSLMISSGEVVLRVSARLGMSPSSTLPPATCSEELLTSRDTSLVSGAPLPRGGTVRTREPDRNMAREEEGTACVRRKKRRHGKKERKREPSAGKSNQTQETREGQCQGSRITSGFRWFVVVAGSAQGGD